jgi:hypothetical protein
MFKKTKKLLIQRKFRETVKIKQTERIVLVCENCQSEQSFKLVGNEDYKKLSNGENDEISNKIC